MADSNTTPEGQSQRAGVEAVVEPVKALGALSGFVIGFYVSHQSGANLTEETLHGLLGAALLFIVAWYFALWLVRELMLQHVEEQRRLYTQKVDEIRTRGGKVAEPTPPGMVPQAVLTPPE